MDMPTRKMHFPVSHRSCSVKLSSFGQQRNSQSTCVHACPHTSHLQLRSPNRMRYIIVVRVQYSNFYRVLIHVFKHTDLPGAFLFQTIHSFNHQNQGVKLPKTDCLYTKDGSLSRDWEGECCKLPGSQRIIVLSTSMDWFKGKIT